MLHSERLDVADGFNDDGLEGGGCVTVNLMV